MKVEIKNCSQNVRTHNLEINLNIPTQYIFQSCARQPFDTAKKPLISLLYIMKETSALGSFNRTHCFKATRIRRWLPWLPVMGHNNQTPYWVVAYVAYGRMGLLKQARI